MNILTPAHNRLSRFQIKIESGRESLLLVLLLHHLKYIRARIEQYLMIFCNTEIAFCSTPASRAKQASNTFVIRKLAPD